MRNEKGITLIALMITIIVLFIILGISLRSKNGIKDEMYNSEDEAFKAQLQGIQHLVLETYVKYKQTGNENVFVGTEITWSSANSYLDEINSASGQSITLKENDYDENDVEQETKYYSLSTEDLRLLGIEKDTESYVVNYETGEVFNISKKVTNSNEALYIFASDKRTE